MTPRSVALHVETLGADPGPGTETFVLLHGYGASTFSWRFWAPRLAERGHVLLVDMKGFGRSPKPDDGRYSPRDQAALVQALLEDRDLEAVTLIGHSLGGGVALLTALGLADTGSARLARLVIVSGAAYAQRLPPFVRLAEHPRLGHAIVRLLGASRLIRRVLEMIVHRPDRVTPEQVEGYAEPLSSEGAIEALIASARQIVPDDLDELVLRYPEIDLPTLLIWGRGDPVVPVEIGERLERDLGDARLHVFEACGHIPAEELPDDSFVVLEAFFADAPGRR